MDPASGGDEMAGGLGGLSVPSGVDPAVAVDGRDDVGDFAGAGSKKSRLTVADLEFLFGGTGSGNNDTQASEENHNLKIDRGTELAQETDLLSKLINEEIKAKMEGSQKDVVQLLQTKIDVKKMHLMQLDRLQNTMELSCALFEEGKTTLLKKCTEDVPMVEESGVNKEVDEKSKELEQEVAKLDAEIHGKMEKLNEMLGLQCETFSEELSSLTVWKSIEANMVIQNARRELIQVFTEATPNRHTGVGIRRIGELNPRPFIVACQRKYGNDDVKAWELINAWQQQVKNSSWHPFRIIDVDGITKQVVDDDDEKLSCLRAEYGDDACAAVKATLSEINEHNPSGGFTVVELWNFDEGRKATLREAVREVCKQLSRKRRR